MADTKNTHISKVFDYIDYYYNLKLIEKEMSFYQNLHFGLSDMQSQISNEIINSIKDDSATHILITGKAATGKTFVLNQVLQNLYNQEENILVIDVKNADSFTKNNLLTQDIQNKILIIDGLDETNPKDYSYLMRLVSNCQFCIATIRSPINKNYRWINSKFNLKIDLDKRYIQEVSKKRDIFNDVNHLYEHVLIENYIFYNLLIKSVDKEELKDILEKTVQTYDESGQILLYNPSVEIPNKEIVLPSREIITGVNILQNSLVEAVQRNPEYIYNMSPRQFEEFVAELYEKQGYKVELTKMTRDGGKDIILYTDGPTGHNMFYVECKQYRKNHPVDISIVRNFYGVVEADKATAGILVTSSSFTPDARSFEKQVFHRMTLVDYVALLNEITKIKV